MRDPVLAMVGKVFGRNENKCDLLLRFSDFPKILNILIQNYFFIHPTLTLFGKVKIALNSIEAAGTEGSRHGRNPKILSKIMKSVFIQFIFNMI